jgi:hypothetical protein
MIGDGENEKRRSAKKYFKGKSHALAWGLMAVGVPLLVSPLIGIPLILAGLILRFWPFKSESDSFIDSVADKDYASHPYVKRAQDLSSFSSYEREPVLIRGFSGEHLKENVFSGRRLGEDGKLRTTPIAATVILCGPDQLGIYQTGIDLTTGNRVNETFWEIFYQDVSSITVKSNSDTIDFKEFFGGFFSRVFKRVNLSLNLSAKDKQEGFTAKNIRKAYTTLKNTYAKHIVGSFLQRELTKTYQIDIIDGDKITIITADERATAVANASNDAMSGDEVARSMFALRSFVREKKRALLYSKMGNAGALV